MATQSSMITINQQEYNLREANLIVSTPMTLNISDEKLANIKSPITMRLEAMVETLDQHREEESKRRIPMFQAAFAVKKKREAEHRAREQKRLERARRHNSKVNKQE